MHFLPNQSINIFYPNEMNMIGVPKTERTEIIKSIRVCPYSQWTLIIRKMVERKFFLPNQSINIVCPNEMNMIGASITKRMETIKSIQVCLISRWTLVIRKMAERKLFSQIQSINIMYPNVENKIVTPISKRVEIIISIHVCLISWINFDYKENGG